MGRQIKGLLYFFITDLRYSLMVFWTILMSILLITWVIAYFLNDVDGGFMTLSLTGPMYIFCSILGFLSVKELIPFSIKRGATRKNIFISLGIFFFILSFSQSIIANTIQVIVDFINGKIGLDSLGFLHLTYFLNDSWLNRIIIDTSIMFFSFSIMFVIGLLFYRFGLAGGGSVVGLIFLVLLVGLVRGWVVDFFIHIYKTVDMVYLYQLFAIGVVIYCISFLLLRRITIVKTK